MAQPNEVQASEAVANRRDTVIVGELVLEREGGLGARPANDEEKSLRGLRAITAAICPHKARIKATLESLPVEAGSLVLDLIIHVALGIPVPPLHCTKTICRIGLDVFCKDPKSIIE